MIKTIFFDLGNVIFSVDKDCAIREIARFLKIKESVVRDIAESSMERDFEMGRFSAVEYLNLLRQEYNITEPVSIEKLIDVWQKPFKPIPDVFEVIAMLKPQAQLVILSNTNELHIRAVRRLSSILNDFDKRIFSYEVGARKPDARIYYEALRIAESSAEESIFIDDLPENVQAARAVGIKSHQFTGVAGLKNFLTDAGFYLN